MRNIELLWDFGYSDKCEIFFLEKKNGNYKIIDRIAASGEPVMFYITKLLARKEKFGYQYVINHLPADAKGKTINGNTVIEILTANGFIINECF